MNQRTILGHSVTLGLVAGRYHRAAGQSRCLGDSRYAGQASIADMERDLSYDVSPAIISRPDSA